MANGKGDWRRPGDEEAYRENFDRIFGPRKAPAGKSLMQQIDEAVRQAAVDGLENWPMGAPQNEGNPNNPSFRNAPIVQE